MKYQHGTLLVANFKVDLAYEYYRHYGVLGEKHRFFKTNKTIKTNNTILVVDYQPRFEGSKDLEYRVWIDGEEGFMNKDVLEREDYYEVVK